MARIRQRWQAYMDEFDPGAEQSFGLDAASWKGTASAAPVKSQNLKCPSAYQPART
jgi:hypothetical protein